MLRVRVELLKFDVCKIMCTPLSASMRRFAGGGPDLGGLHWTSHEVNVTMMLLQGSMNSRVIHNFEVNDYEPE